MSSSRRNVIVSFRLNRDVHRITGKKNPDAKVEIVEFGRDVSGRTARRGLKNPARWPGFFITAG